jgi:hypothetical protein
MRLIDTRTGQLVSQINPVRNSYAILSHTWGSDDEEVSFQNFHNPLVAREKIGLSKIEGMCTLASQRDIHYVWVDTCCIDKSSSAELSEAINSMFKWYQDAAFCAVYLPDLSIDTPFEVGFPNCRWHTRGWTLQELIAPQRVEFYDEAWGFRGDRSSTQSILAQVTLIDAEVLQGTKGLEKVPIARRMSWAATRNTTRVEDEAYCLLGIFGVNMPMIYGEGAKAYLRLQEEIAKDSGDVSLFAWTSQAKGGDSDQIYRGIFAKSPKEFLGARLLKYRNKDMLIEKEFSVTNRGLKVEAALVEVPDLTDDLIMNLGVSERDDWPKWSSVGWKGIFLAKTSNGFVRSNSTQLYTSGMHKRYMHSTEQLMLHIRKHVSPEESVAIQRRFANAIHLGKNSDFTVKYAAPAHLWDPLRRVFLHQGHGINAYLVLQVFPKLKEHAGFQAIVACSTMNDKPVCTLWVDNADDPRWHVVQNFLETRKEVTDYVAVDYLSTLVGGDTSLVLKSTEKRRNRDKKTGKLIAVAANINSYLDLSEGTPGFALEVEITTS